MATDFVQALVRRFEVGATYDIRVRSRSRRISVSTEEGRRELAVVLEEAFSELRAGRSISYTVIRRHSR